MSTRRKRNFIVALLTAVLVIIAYSIFKYSSDLTSAVQDNREKSIAVMPFKNIGPNDSDEYFSDGFTIEVTNYLAKVGELKVMSRTSVEQYKSQQNKDSKTIGRELGVSYLLEGSVQKSGNKVRIGIQLVETASGFQVWSNEYDKEITDVLQMQSEISREVTDALKIVLTDAERKIIERQEAVGLNAYDFYLKAKGH